MLPNTPLEIAFLLPSPLIHLAVLDAGLYEKATFWLIVAALQYLKPEGIHPIDVLDCIVKQNVAEYLVS